MHGKRLERALLLVAIGAVAAGCGNDQSSEGGAPPDHAPLDRFGQVQEERQLTQTEMDTLRSFKKRLRVTRDQYWDDRGGVLGNEWLTVWYPAGNLTPMHGMAVFDRVDRAREQARLLFGRVPAAMLTIVCSASMDSYGEETGREWWHYSRIEGDKIVLQPVATIAMRGLIEIVPAREYYEWTIGKLSERKAPRWVEEGFASLISGERDVVGHYPDSSGQAGRTHRYFLGA